MEKQHTEPDNVAPQSHDGAVPDLHAAAPVPDLMFEAPRELNADQLLRRSEILAQSRAAALARRQPIIRRL
jgi:hypothetical protein